jgi:hypothetical protein
LNSPPFAWGKEPHSFFRRVLPACQTISHADSKKIKPLITLREGLYDKLMRAIFF